MTETMNPRTEPAEAPVRRLTRVDEGRWLGGVAAGLGRYFDVNPLVYRIAFAALAFAGGTGILLYIAAWLVIPGEGRQDSAAVEALREHRERPWLLLGVGLLLFTAVLVLSEADLWTGFGNIWLAAVLGGAALLWWHLAHRGDVRPVPPPSPVAGDAAPAPPAATPCAPRKPSLLAPVLGALLAAAGTFGLLAVLDVYSVDADLALAAAVAIVGAAIAVGAFTGYRVVALVVLGVALLGAFGIAASTPVSVSAGAGDRLERPLGVATLERSYEFGIGDFEVDLSNLALPAGDTRVDASLGIGDLLVVVPEGVALEIDARAGAGEVVVLGATDDGLSADEKASVPGTEPGAPVLHVDADVGLGSVEVRRG